MKTLAKVLEGIGITSFLISGGAMDGPSMIVPFIIALAGIGLAFLGMQIEEFYA